MSRILITSALPYANGDIHLGHMVEHIQTDIHARFLRIHASHQVCYVCADDTHGTSIMIRARAEGVSEEAFIKRMHGLHVADFQGFLISHDIYGSTNSEDNRQQCHQIWQGIRQAGLVQEREVEQLYDPKAGTFLADRFVKGTCPKCGAVDQYGDSCEKCGAAYAPTDLKNAVSTLSGATPELRRAKHLFVAIEGLRADISAWLKEPGHVEPEVRNYLEGHFLVEGQTLRDWDISRPAPYFGFEIPDAPGHYWYVWFDAPIGYIGNLQTWCKNKGEDFGNWWGPTTDKNRDTKILHVIGKDIVYFHTLFWPGMLHAAGYKLPDRVQVHGFLTVNGEKMSKSRGTFILAKTYLAHLDPQYLRYFIAAKMNAGTGDMDLDLAEFAAKVNSDLVGKLVNLASRTAKFVAGQKLPHGIKNPFEDQIVDLFRTVGNHYLSWNTAQAVQEIMSLADRANEYVEKNAPWTLAKDPQRTEELKIVCFVSLEVFWNLCRLLAPILPNLTRDAGRLFGIDNTEKDEDPIGQLYWGFNTLWGRTVEPYRHLMQRIDPAKTAAIIEASKADLAAAPQAAPSIAPLAPTCTIDDFKKIDLRIAKILSAEHVKGADKLLKLQLDLGPYGQRQVFAGIKAAYPDPQLLVGRLVPMVANLAPRQMKFGLSEGMVLAAGPGAPDIFLMTPDTGAKPGDAVG